jgi:hypothetical protein
MRRPFKDKRTVGPFLDFNEDSPPDEYVIGSKPSDEYIIGSVDSGPTNSQIDFMFNKKLNEPGVDRNTIVRSAKNAIDPYYTVKWIANPEFDRSALLVGIEERTQDVEELESINQNMRSFVASSCDNLKIVYTYSTCPVSKEKIIEAMQEEQ